jgi:hypothetical protein
MPPMKTAASPSTLYETESGPSSPWSPRLSSVCSRAVGPCEKRPVMLATTAPRTQRVRSAGDDIIDADLTPWIWLLLRAPTLGFLR